MKTELMPVEKNVIIIPYDENPYMTNETEDGFLTTDGTFLNEDSGELDKMKQDFLCGHVIEVGPKCDFVKEGDDVIYYAGAARPVPFLDKGFFLVSEPTLLAVIGSNLKQRLKSK